MSNINSLKFVTIKRQFAVMLEDAIHVLLPTDIDPADKEAVDEWALENYDRLYCAIKDGDETAGALLWEDEHKHDLDFPEGEITAEVD